MFNLLNNDLLFLSIFSTSIVIVGFVFYRISLAYVNNNYNMDVNPDTNTIYLYFKRNTGDILSSNVVECNIEVPLPIEVVQEIRELYGVEFAVGEADFILHTYIIPYIEPGAVNDLILMILNQF
jgi:hypothetical protein